MNSQRFVDTIFSFIRSCEPLHCIMDHSPRNGNNPREIWIANKKIMFTKGPNSQAGAIDVHQLNGCFELMLGQKDFNINCLHDVIKGNCARSTVKWILKKSGVIRDLGDHKWCLKS